jgi:hypothetical protein
MTRAHNNCVFAKTSSTFWFFIIEVPTLEIKIKLFPIRREADRAGPPAAIHNVASLPSASLSSYHRSPARIGANRPPDLEPAQPASRLSSFRPATQAPNGLLPSSSYPRTADLDAVASSPSRLSSCQPPGLATSSCRPCPHAAGLILKLVPSCRRPRAQAPPQPSLCYQLHDQSSNQKSAMPPPKSRWRSLLELFS